MPARTGNPKRGGRLAINVFIDATVASTARDVVYGTPGLTLSRFVEDALREEIARREAKRGEPFLPRPRLALRRGRPALAYREIESSPSV